MFDYFENFFDEEIIEIKDKFQFKSRFKIIDTEKGFHVEFEHFYTQKLNKKQKEILSKLNITKLNINEISSLEINDFKINKLYIGSFMIYYYIDGKYDIFFEKILI